MLAQKAPFLRCHVTVAAPLIEVGGHGGAHHEVGRRLVDACVWLTRGLSVMRGRAWGCHPVCRRLGAGERRAKCACERAGNCQRNDAQAHIRPNPSLHLVPFLVRQPVPQMRMQTPARTGCESFLSCEVSTEQPQTVKESKHACFTWRHRRGKFCN
jgi:hypothetical protein